MKGRCCKLKKTKICVCNQSMKGRCLIRRCCKLKRTKTKTRVIRGCSELKKTKEEEDIQRHSTSPSPCGSGIAI
ncbi:unnamed protein product [Arabis nemorensis]|uniref:Uncharacterized protein n=1 Tax=Arabis nemorensis TaxID=586526 RepID=A0A565CLX6_9BRAS|nr:unnamed protein product [Arabis nemorensis]